MKPLFCRHLHLPVKYPTNGFTLPELLVGVVLGAVVLAALGGSVLVSQMRISTRIRMDIERRDALNRAIALIRSEIAAADRIYLNEDDFLCPQPNIKLDFSSKAAATIPVCYSVQPLENISFIYQQRPWFGPCVLTRTGPYYNQASGKTSGSAISVHIILDHMSACSTGSSSLIVTAGQAVDSGKILRDVDIEIKQTPDLITRFSARAGSNPLYSVNAATSDSTQPGPTCNWYASTDKSSIPKNCSQNIYYLSKSYSQYSLNGDCTYDKCVVVDPSANKDPDKGVKTFANVDVLVFRDREIRP